MEHIRNIFSAVIRSLYEENERNRKMNNKKQNKKSYVCYVYGQIYAEYLKQGRSEYVLIENEDVRSWKRIVNWLKENGNIVDFAYSDNSEDPDKLIIQGFNEKKMLYKKYTNAVRANVKKEQVA